VSAHERVPSLFFLGPDAAEADGVAAVVAVLAGAGRRAAVVGDVVPRAAADDVLFGALVHPGAAVGGGALVVGVPAVRRPLPDVAVHVVQAPRVRLLGADRRVVALGVALEPAVVADAGGAAAERVGRGGAGPAGVLPLGLRRQADHLVIFDELAFA